MEWPDGSRLTALVNIAPLRNADGELIGAINCFQDITERKQLENTLRENESQLRLVIETIPAMAWIVLPDGCLDFINQRWLDAVDKWRRVLSAGEPYEDETFAPR